VSPATGGEPGGLAPVDRLFLLGLYGLECGAAGALLALHRLGDRPITGSPHGITQVAYFGSVLLLLMAVVLLVSRLVRPGTGGRRPQVLTLMLNALTVGSLLLVGELTVRLFARHDGDVRVFLGTALVPRRWDDVAARYQRVIRESMRAGDLSYIAYDDRLGWSLAPGQASDDGLYFSSAEGIRSPRPGMRMLDMHPTSRTPAPYRIALIGDSHTFGEDVRYQDTWGSQLELLLGPCAEVRNFGVPGYGVDQAVLRYERDARPWAPRMVILAPIADDFTRTMVVYLFLNFPSWDYPFSKPRFAFRDGTLALLNSPPIPPAAVFSRKRVLDLPLIEYDIAFHPEQWRFHPYDHSLLARWLAARYPPWHAASDSVSDSMSEVAVNGAILRRFLDLAAADGVTPILAYLPSVSELQFPTAASNTGRVLLAEIAAERGVRHTDLTPPLETVDPARRRSTLGYRIHYSPLANQAIAQHLAGVVRAAMGQTCGGP
jgi:hypothetical protein